MASTETTTTTTTATTTAEYVKGVSPPSPPALEFKLSASDLFLRVLLLVASVVVIVVVVTSKETELIMDPRITFPIPRTAKFSDSPAFIYFVVAFSVSALYSILTGLVSLSIVWKPSIPPKWLLTLITLDVLMLSIVASATGTAGGVAYIGIHGNSHVGWVKICHIYGKFCRHVGSSIVVALVAFFVLVLLVLSNAHSLYRRVHP